MTIQEEIDQLSAKVTALIMLVEALYVGELSRDDNAEAIGEAMVASVLKAEAAARAKVGASDYSLHVSEMLTSLTDRAVARARLQRRKKRPS